MHCQNLSWCTVIITAPLPLSKSLSLHSHSMCTWTAGLPCLYSTLHLSHTLSLILCALDLPACLALPPTPTLLFYVLLICRLALPCLPALSFTTLLMFALSHCSANLPASQRSVATFERTCRAWLVLISSLSHLHTVSLSLARCAADQRDSQGWVHWEWKAVWLWTRLT